MEPAPKRQKKPEGVSTPECTICCEPLVDLVSACTLRPCGHVFHASCIWTWATGQAVGSKVPTCPLCRSTFSGCTHADLRPVTETESPMTPLFPTVFAHGQHVCAAVFDCLATECRRLSEDLQITQDDVMARQIAVQPESVLFAFPTIFDALLVREELRERGSL